MSVLYFTDKIGDRFDAILFFFLYNFHNRAAYDYSFAVGAHSICLFQPGNPFINNIGADFHQTPCSLYHRYVL